MSFQRLDTVNFEMRRQFARENQVISNRRADIDIATVRRNPPNQVDKDILFVRFVDVPLSIPRALAFPELVFKNPDAIIKSMNGARHDQQRLPLPALPHKQPLSRQTKLA